MRHQRVERHARRATSVRFTSMLAIPFAFGLSAIIRSHYDTLGLRRDANAEQIKKAYKQAALRHHPDRGGSDAAFEAVNEAFEVLSDKQKKRQYDAQQQFGGASQSSSPEGETRPAVRVPSPCTLRELGGWDPVPLVIVLAARGLSVWDMHNLGLPPMIWLQPGSAAGDTIRIPMASGGSDLVLNLMEVPHRRFKRRGDALEADVHLPAWHNAFGRQLLPVFMRGIDGRFVTVRKRGERVVRSGESVLLHGRGMPTRGNVAWRTPDEAQRGDLLVRLHLRTVKASVIRATRNVAAASLGAIVGLRAARLKKEQDDDIDGGGRRRRSLPGALLSGFSWLLFGDLRRR